MSNKKVIKTFNELSLRPDLYENFRFASTKYPSLEHYVAECVK